MFNYVKLVKKIFVNFDTFFKFKLNKFYMVMVNISELIAKYIKKRTNKTQYVKISEAFRYKINNVK